MCGHACRQVPVLRLGQTRSVDHHSCLLAELRAAPETCPASPRWAGDWLGLPVEPRRPPLFCEARGRRGRLTGPQNESAVAVQWHQLAVGAPGARSACGHVLLVA